MAFYTLLKFTNIDSEDFIGKWGGEEYKVKAGETEMFPVFLAKHFAKHLVDKILIRSGNSNYSDELARKPLLEKILGEEVAAKPKPKEMSEAERVKQEVKEAQKEFEDLAAKREEEIKKKRIEALAKARKIKAEKNKKK